ncbi:hypothetical protein AYK24_08795 [Thermoplasmatales archaeon SG8-52-4]|nr:MAG: hypothetical protein AYK24_08795 [Thermoplasmatales archaeon SG8-52-4]
MGEAKKQKIGLRILLFAFLLSCIFMILTTPLHEATHWIISEIDPYIDPVEFHLFDDNSFKRNENILSSALGYVVVKEKYPGAFNDRPLWMDTLQEIICISVQVFPTCFLVSKILGFLLNKKLDLQSNTKTNFL